MSGEEIKKTILATIIYHDVLDFPMTLLEVSSFLINPARLSFARQNLGGRAQNEPVTPGTIREGLECLLVQGRIETAMGFYFLPGRRRLCQERIEKNKIAEQKWKKVRRYLWAVQSVPYVEAVLASGSLAFGHTDEESDLDVLVIARKGRIWLTRILVSWLAELQDARRTRKDKIAPDKICFNHFIASNSLRLSCPSLYNAQTYARLAPIYLREENVWKEFCRCNEWISDFISPACLGSADDAAPFYQKREIDRSAVLRGIKQAAEKFLDVTLTGNLLEKAARLIQFRRINQKLPGRVKADDRQLEFHPYSVEKRILAEFNQKLRAAGDFGGYEEKDSGLRTWNMKHET